MNYFPFHLGDYAAHTGHLEPMEDLAYRRLLDQYYMREGPLPADIQTTAKLVRLRSCAADVESVLREFFVLTEAGWTHSRCDEEIEKMQDKQAKARASAAASVNARRAKAERTLSDDATNAERTLQEKPTDVELPTPTPTPTPKNKKSRLPADFAPNETGMKAALVAGVDVEAELRQFRNHHESKGSVMADWQAAWRTWTGHAVQFGRGGKGVRVAQSDWSKAAGFDSIYEAENAGCRQSNAHLFHNGKRDEVAA